MKVGDKIRYVNKMNFDTSYCITEYDGNVVRKEAKLGWEGYICYIFQDVNEVLDVAAGRLFIALKYPAYFCHIDKSVEGPPWCADFYGDSIELVKEVKLCSCNIMELMRLGCKCGGK